jgi:PAS domain-containing protein
LSLLLSQPGSLTEHEHDRAQIQEESDTLEKDEDLFIQKLTTENNIFLFHPNLKALYFDPPANLDKEVHDYAKEARKVAVAPEGSLSPENPDETTIREKNYTGLLNGLNRGVDLLRNELDIERTILLRAQAAFFFFTMLTLLLTGRLIFRPMVKKIVEETHRLTSSERQLSAVFNTVGEAIFSTDDKGRILSVNHEAARLWEYEIKDLLGQGLDYLFLSPGFFDEASKQCTSWRKSPLIRPKSTER